MITKKLDVFFIVRNGSSAQYLRLPFCCVWISFVLPRQVVKPLLELREAVDNAASGNYLIDFDLRGEGEVVELGKSVRNLITQVRPTA